MKHRQQSKDYCWVIQDLSAHCIESIVNEKNAKEIRKYLKIESIKDCHYDRHYEMEQKLRSSHDFIGMMKIGAPYLVTSIECFIGVW